MLVRFIVNCRSIERHLFQASDSAIIATYVIIYLDPHFNATLFFFQSYWFVLMTLPSSLSLQAKNARKVHAMKAYWITGWSWALWLLSTWVKCYLLVTNLSQPERKSSRLVSIVPKRWISCERNLPTAVIRGRFHSSISGQVVQNIPGPYSMDRVLPGDYVKFQSPSQFASRLSCWGTP